MSLAVRLFVIDYAFIDSSGKKRQQNFPRVLSSLVLMGPGSNRQYRVIRESLSSVFYRLYI